MTRIALTCVAVLVPVLSLPARAFSQALGLDVVSIATSHSLLGNRLTGAAVGAGFPARDEPFTVKLAAEFARGSSDRTAIVCAGLVAPGTCPSESAHDDARVAMTSAGFGIRLLGGRRASIGITTDVFLGWVGADTRGVTTGNTLSGGKLLWGPAGGVRGSWMPVPQWPLALEASYSLLRFIPIFTDRVVDGYTPFEESFDGKRIMVGVAWSPRRQ